MRRGPLTFLARPSAVAAAVVSCVAAAVSLTVAAAPASAVAACDAQTHRSALGKRPAGRPALVIGDSVMLGAAGPVASAGFEVDARGCRQWAAGLQIVRARAHAHSLPHLVFIGLGTNGSVSRGDLDTALRLLGPDRILGLITPREVGGHGGSDAAIERQYAKAHPGRVVIADWVHESAAHGSWFGGGDGIHVGAAGGAAGGAGMAALLRTTRKNVAPELCAA